MNFSLDPYNILAGFVFGTIGWGAFSYGRRLELWQPKSIGLALMIYPYFFTTSDVTGFPLADGRFFTLVSPAHAN